MSFDLTFYTQKFTKKRVEEIVNKLQNPNLEKLEIGQGWFDFDKEGDNFKIAGQEIYVESSVSGFGPSEYFKDQEELDNHDKLLKKLLANLDLKITFCCHDGTDTAVVCLFLTLSTFVNPESILMDMQTGENYTAEAIISRLQEIQEEFKDE